MLDWNVTQILFFPFIVVVLTKGKGKASSSKSCYKQQIKEYLFTVNIQLCYIPSLYCLVRKGNKEPQLILQESELEQVIECTLVLFCRWHRNGRTTWNLWHKVGDWENEPREASWKLATITTKSCTWEGRAPYNDTGWCLTVCGAALQRKSWGASDRWQAWHEPA